MELLQPKCKAMIRFIILILLLSFDLVAQGFMQDNSRAVYFKLDITEAPEINFSKLKNDYGIDVNAKLSIYLSASLEKRLASRSKRFRMGDNDLFIFQYQAEATSISYSTYNFTEVKKYISPTEIDNLESFAYSQIVNNRINSVQIIPAYFDTAKDLMYFNVNDRLRSQFQDYSQRVIIPISFNESVISSGNDIQNINYTRFNNLFYDVDILPQRIGSFSLTPLVGGNLPDRINMGDNLIGIRSNRATMFNKPDSLLLFYEIQNSDTDSLVYYAFSNIITPVAAIENGYRTITADTLFFSSTIANRADFGTKGLYVLFPVPEIQQNDIRLASIPGMPDTLNLYTESGARNLINRQLNVIAEISNFRNISSHSFIFSNSALSLIDSLGLENIETRGLDTLKSGDLARDRNDPTKIYLPLYTTTQISAILDSQHTALVDSVSNYYLDVYSNRMPQVNETKFDDFYTGLIIAFTGLSSIALAFL